MKLYLDTSTNVAKLKLDNKSYEKDLNRDMAEKLLEFIHEKLEENHKDWHDITEIEFMAGPGSFTGLRIGASIANALASELKVPLKDHLGNSHQIILPLYDRPANISQPKK